MDKYVEAENRLAELLGWKLKRVGDVPTGWIDQDGRYKADRPAWCFHWSACGPLMVGHGCYTYEDRIVPDEILCSWQGNKQPVFTKIADHPDRDTAIRYAIVQAVISKLSTQTEE
jgi:hypothetical protein